MGMQWGRTWVLGLGLAIGMVAATAGSVKESVAAVRKQAVASMVVTGEVVIDERGNVTSHAIDKPEVLPAGVVQLLGQTIPQWKFHPVKVAGVAHPARSAMRVRVVAQKLDDGAYSVSLTDAAFPAKDPVPGSYASSKKMVHPRYPDDAIRRGAEAMVYVAVKVSPDGRVEDAVAEQVNLPFVASERVMDAYRTLFADASVKAAKASVFNPPTVGEDVGQSTSVRVPYEFNLGTDKAPAYGQWVSYIPGPYNPAPWRVGELQGAPDLLATGTGVQPMSEATGLRLQTALGGG